MKRIIFVEKFLLMNRIFHARVTWYMLLLLILLSGLTFCSLWNKEVLIGGCTLILTIIVIERIIHTAYTVTTDGFLMIDNGRFSQKMQIPLNSIQRIEKCRSVNFGRFHLLEYLLVHYGEGQTISIVPVKADDLIKHIESKKGTIN